MKNHILSRPGGSGNPEPAETPQHERRFDERGIALQTVIIMVVLIAIAGAIAAVLFSAAEEASDELENSSISVNAYAAATEGQCTRSNGDWRSAAPGDVDFGKIQAAGRTTHSDGTAIAKADLAASKKGKGWCEPKT